MDGTMAYDETLADRIRTAFAGRSGITERKMFGGLAFLYRERMCCGIVGNDLMVRVPHAEFDAAMRRPHVRPMDFTGRPLRGFVFVSASGVRTTRALQAWLARGEQAAEQHAEGTGRTSRSSRPPRAGRTRS
jgi:hypothetical protein